VVLALLAGALVAVALRGTRTMRILAVVAAALALAFAVHALSVPPTNGANIFDPSSGAYAPNAPGAAIGVTVAIAGLGTALVGLAVSFTAEWGH
jgi:lipopolysaccharide export LptBFGC system permease protein LptF